MSDLHSLATDLFTFFFPYFWLLMLGRYYFLVTSESFFDWRFYLLPFWHAFVHMTFWMPPAWTLSWSLLFHYSFSVYLGFKFMGGWWTFFKWFQCGFYYGILHFSNLKLRHQLFRQDVRFSFPTLQVQLFGVNNLRRCYPSRVYNPVQHRQLAIVIRIRSRPMTLRQLLHSLRKFDEYCRHSSDNPTQDERTRWHQSTTSVSYNSLNQAANDDPNESESFFDCETFHEGEPFDDIASFHDTFSEPSEILPTSELKSESPRSINEYIDPRQGVMTLVTNQAPPTQSARVAKFIQLLQRYARQDTVLPTDQIRRVRRAHYAAVAFLALDEIGAARGIQCGLAADQEGGETLLVFDTGCAHSITPVRSDFVSELEPAPHIGITGFDSSQDSRPVQGVGWVEWKVRDMHGTISVIRTRAYYLPEASIRLFCPQNYAEEQGRSDEEVGEFRGGAQSIRFTDEYLSELEFPFTPNIRLPLMTLDDDIPETGLSDSLSFYLKDYLALNLNIVESDQETLQLLQAINTNLTKPQKELLLWHQRLGHAGFSWIQDLMHPGKTNVGDDSTTPFITTKQTSTSRCPHPKCEACLFAKQHRRTSDSQKVVNKPDREMAIRRNNLKPGDLVSGDQWISSQPGRLPHTFGKEADDDRYHGGTILVDSSSSYLHVHCQVSLRTGETLVGKHAFERFARLNGVKIKKYRVDNHPFNSAEFLADIDLQDQLIEFSGVGAHFQNGVAERAIQTVTSWARAMMLHQMRHWPEAFDESHWPFALEHAVYLWNNMPRSRSGLTPLELFTGTKQSTIPALSQARVWGCPVYVLDPKLQDGHKLPKWTKRSRLGIYLGMSPGHADSVGRILNPETGAISPQYHVVYDELFTTAFGAYTDELFDEDLWTGLLQLQGEETLLETRDRDSDVVLTPATDLFRSFVDSVSSASEGEDDDDEPFSSSDSEPATESTASLSDSESDSDDQTVQVRNPRSQRNPTETEGVRNSPTTTTTRFGRQVRRAPTYAPTLDIPNDTSRPTLQLQPLRQHQGICHSNRQYTMPEA